MKPSPQGTIGTSTVLVADHDDKSRSATVAVLVSAGYDVVPLGTLPGLFACKPPSTRCCLVMDYRLEGMNGLDLWAQLGGEQGQLPIVFMSANANLATAVRAIKAGAIDFLAKPVCEDALLDAVHVALEQDAIRRARQTALQQIEILYGSLSPREREVMGHVTAGLMNKQVAGIMGLSEITVKVHRGHVMRKMNARTFADLVRKAHVLPVGRSMAGQDAPFMPYRSRVPLPISSASSLHA